MSHGCKRNGNPLLNWIQDIFPHKMEKTCPKPLQSFLALGLTCRLDVPWKLKLRPSIMKNCPMHYTEIFLVGKLEKNLLKIFDKFNTFVQNIDCGYTLEPPR